MLIPVQAEYLALEGLGQLLRTLSEVRKSLNPRLVREGEVVTLFDRRNRLCHDVDAQLISGALGSGHTIKLLNNFFGMTVANAMAEAFAMADVQGVDRQSLYDVMSAGPLHSGMMDFVKGYGVDGDPAQLAFAIKNAAKDVGYYAKMADDAGVDSIMSQSTLKALNTARDEGRGDDMVSQMVDFYVDKMKP